MSINLLTSSIYTTTHWINPAGLNREMSQTRRMTATAIPDDVFIDNILSRLSVNKLARVRCVSKQWNSLFNDDVFIKLHLAMRKKAVAEDTSRLRVLASLTPVAQVIMCERFDDGHLYDMIATIKTRQIIGLLAMCGIATAAVVGSCDGLLCIRISEEEDTKFAVWNPSTRVFKVISIVDVVSGEETQRSPAGYSSSSSMFEVDQAHHRGFGYDWATDDYKIVMFRNSPVAETVVVEILTVGTLRWRKVEFKLIEGEFLGSQGSFFRGCLHWLHLIRSASRGGPEYRMQIVSFNLSTEKFETNRIQLPPIPDGVRDDDERFRYLMVFDDELWLLNAEMKGSPMEIWSYGGADCCLWTKKLVLCPPGEKEWVFPLYFMRDGLVLVAVEENELMYYDPEKKSYWEAQLWGRSGYNCELGSDWTRDVYESLVSPYRIPNPPSRGPSAPTSRSKIQVS